MSTNLLTGLSEGSFDRLLVRNASGQLVNILTLVGGGSGGSGSGLVTSAAAPLQIDSNGRISLDNFSQVYLEDQGGQVHTLDVVAGSLRLNGNPIAETADLTGFLVQSDIAGLQPALTAGANITIDPTTNTISSTGGSGSSYIVSVSAPLARDAQGDLSIDLSGYATVAAVAGKMPLFTTQGALSLSNNILSTTGLEISSITDPLEYVSSTKEVRIKSNTFFTQSESLTQFYTKSVVDGFLGQKQDLLSSANAGSGISIQTVNGQLQIANTAQGGSGGSGTGLSVSLDGTTVSVSGLNFIRRSSSISQGILSLAESSEQDQLRLFHATVADAKALQQTSTGSLSWNGQTLATDAALTAGLASKQNTLTPANGVVISGSQIALASSLPVTDQNGNIGLLEHAASGALLWDGDFVATQAFVGQTYQPKLTQASNGSTDVQISATGVISLTGQDSRGALKLLDANSNVYELRIGSNGSLERHDPTAVPSLRRNYDQELVGKQTAFTPQAPLSFSSSQSGQSILQSLWKPSGISLSAGLVASSVSDAQGLLTLGLDGSESRQALNLVDSGGIVRQLSSNTNGELVFNATNLSTEINSKALDFTAQLPLEFFTFSGARYLHSKFKPTTVQTSAATGLLSVASDSTGALELSLSGLETRAQLRLLRSGSNSVYSELTANASDDLVWSASGGSTLNISALPTAIAAKQDVISTVNPLGILYLSHTFSGTTSVHSVSTNGTHLQFDNNRLALFSECSGAGNLIDSARGYGVSLGASLVSINSVFRPDPLKHAFGVYESQGSGLQPSQNSGQSYYGIALSDPRANSNFGLAIFGGTASNRPNLLGTSTGPNTGEVDPAIFVENSTGYVGVGIVNPTRELDVGGQVGALSAVINTITCNSLTVNGNKQFDIMHPTPEKREQGYRLRHFCTESDRPDLFYRMTVTMEHSTQTFELPDYFDDLTSDPIALVVPYRHFGSGWAEFDRNRITVHVTTLGVWHLQVIALRTDPGYEERDNRVEYIPDPAPPSKSRVSGP